MKKNNKNLFTKEFNTEQEVSRVKQDLMKHRQLNDRLALSRDDYNFIRNSTALTNKEKLVILDTYFSLNEFIERAIEAKCRKEKIY